MTRDNLRNREMPKPFECSLCKYIETVRHLPITELCLDYFMFMLMKFFNALITLFQTLASQWLCSKIYL
jgi:hypothetical protein